MRSAFAVLFLISAAALLCAPCRAEELTWNQAAAQALAHNPALQAARAGVNASRSGVTQSQSVFYPSLSLDGSWGNSVRQLYAPSGAAFLPFPDTSGTSSSAYSLGLSAKWNIFNGFSDLAGAQKADAVLEQSLASYKLDSSNLRSQVHQAFNQLLFTQENLKLLAKIKDRLNQDSRYIKLRYDSGQEARWTYLQAQADEDQIAWQIGQAGLNVEAQRAQLGAYLGLSGPASAALEAVGDLQADAPPGTFEAARGGIGQHPSLASQRAAVAAGRAALWQSQASRYPSLSANAGYNYDGAGSNWPPLASSWSVGLTLGYNLFTGFAEEAAIDQAAQSLAAAEGTLDDLRNNLEARLYQAWASFRSSFQRQPLADFQLKTSQERFNTLQKLYQAGTTTFLDFTTAENQLTQVQQQQLSTRLDTLQAEASYDQALGLDLESVASLPEKP